MATAHSVIRPARLSDREAVLAISAQVWGGEDYVPEVLDRWLADPDGEFSVATLHGRVVGFSKLTRHGPGEWWLEGLRVDPRYRGRGIARRLHEHQVALARRIGSGALRFSTGDGNRASQHLGLSSGFRDVGHNLELAAPALTRTAAARAGLLPLQTWRSVDRPDLERFLLRSARLRACHGLFSVDWKAYELTPVRLAKYVAARGAVGWRDARGRVVALALVRRHAHGEPGLQVAFADARRRGPLGLTALGLALRDLARRRRLKRVLLDAPTGSPWQHAFERAGFRLAWDPGDEQWVFELSLP